MHLADKNHLNSLRELPKLSQQWRVKCHQQAKQQWATKKPHSTEKSTKQARPRTQGVATINKLYRVFQRKALLCSRSSFTQVAFCGILRLTARMVMVFTYEFWNRVKNALHMGKTAAILGKMTTLRLWHHQGCTKKSARCRFAGGRSQTMQKIKIFFLSLV